MHSKICMYDVVCYGAISMDISGRLTSQWAKGQQADATDYQISPGGDATLVALSLASMGLKTALCGGPIGNDPMGDYLRNILTSNGVEIAAVEAGKTSLSFVIVSDCGQRSSVTFHEGTPIDSIPVPVDIIARSKYLYVDGCYGNNSAIAGNVARASGIPSLLNLDTESIKHAGIFNTVISSEDTARQISIDPAEAAHILHTMNNGTAIITLGEKGCICDAGQTIYMPACHIKAIDTTGAGAAFAAGFIYSQLRGDTIMESLRIANASGAYKSLVRGSYRSLRKNDLDIFMEGHC